ncbi:copper chaperone PCu(A)C [Pseudoalteromonas sp. JBTF-M23]|uniref:Copper chaperone PCu(A)C n=1 Tax=Pseudoalteromonas caenipelagi TaxID=2726988 RepID=A0A849VJ46_9GAMM|nr:copper chaperone PCu(A)C [Pseudoalteromonas caenipelagi]NOU51751.1 copper chaperone PCu(A)C [Pseudoalteromonas caenipelagi]
MFSKYLGALVSATLILIPSLAFSEQPQAQEQHSNLHLSHAKIRQFLPAAASTAAYFSLANHSDKQRVLKSALISKIGRVEMHEHVHQNGMMRMQQVNEIAIAAHSSIDFKPGGYHLMAFEPAEALKKGEQLSLTLHFANGEQVTAPLHIVSLQDDMKQKGHDHSQHNHH